MYLNAIQSIARILSILDHFWVFIFLIFLIFFTSAKFENWLVNNFSDIAGTFY